MSCDLARVLHGLIHKYNNQVFMISSLQKDLLIFIIIMLLMFSWIKIKNRQNLNFSWFQD